MLGYAKYIIFFSFLITSCDINTSYFPNNDKINVITTTTFAGDLVTQIAGDRVNHYTLMNYGIDPHSYKATEGDVIKMYEADLIVYNGLELEGKMEEVLEKIDGITNTFSLNGNAETEHLIASEGNYFYDPHVWMDPNLWEKAAYRLYIEVSEIDPKNKSYYLDNYNRYKDSLTQLDSWIRTQVDKIEKERRVLITAHDAFNYFGKAYNFEVIGIQGINSKEETGIKRINYLAELIAERKISAIFIESSVSPRFVNSLIESVESSGQKLIIGGELFSDSLGDSSTKADNYLDMMRYNVSTIINALQ